MQKKTLNPIFLSRLEGVCPFLTGGETLRLATANSEIHSQLKDALSAKKRLCFDFHFQKLIHKRKKRIFTLENFFASEALARLVLTRDFEEIDPERVSEEPFLTAKHVNPNLRNTDVNKIFKFGKSFYLVLRKSLFGQSMGAKLLGQAPAKQSEPAKAKYDRAIKEVSEEFGDADLFLDKTLLLQRHKRLQSKLRSKDEARDAQRKNAFKDVFGELLRVRRLGVLLSTYGDFSLSVFDVKEGKEVFHRSDHKYVVRKKNGTKQSKKDKAKKIRSVGSNIRRANERKHLANIEQILARHLEDLRSCDLVMVSAPGDNLVELKGLFSKFDFAGVSFRSLGQTTGKAKYSKLLEVRASLLKAVVITF